MRNAILVLLAVAAIGLGALLLTQSRKAKEREVLATKLRLELEQKARQVSELEAGEARAKRQVRELAKVSDELMAGAKAREATLSNAAASKGLSGDSGETSEDGKGGFGKLMESMMNDPEMKKVIIEQQRAMMDQLYDPLLKKMQLSPETAQAFKDLLMENVANGTEMASSMFSGTNRTEMAAKMAENTKALEQRMKDLLGEEGYAQYQDYQQTAGERAQLSMFRQQISGSGEPITDEQNEQLLALMGDAKKQAAANSGLDPSAMKDQLSGAFDPDQIDKMLGMQDAVNQDVYARASSFLTPSQMAAFGKYQTNQMQMMRAGMVMARKFMGSKTTR